MAPTIRIKREDAIKALQDRLAAVVAANATYTAEKKRFDEDLEYYQMRLKEAVMQQITKDPVANLLKVVLVGPGEYDDDIGQRRTDTRLRAFITTKGMKPLPKTPEQPNGRIQDTSRLERQIHLLSLATDDTVPVSLFKGLQDLL